MNHRVVGRGCWLSGQVKRYGKVKEMGGFGRPRFDGTEQMDRAAFGGRLGQVPGGDGKTMQFPRLRVNLFSVHVSPTHLMILRPFSRNLVGRYSRFKNYTDSSS